MLIQLTEPGLEPPSGSSPDGGDHGGIAVGIDLGTTHSLIAFVDDKTGAVVPILNDDGTPLFPSVVWYGPHETIPCGTVGHLPGMDRAGDGGVCLASTKRLLSPRLGGGDDTDPLQGGGLLPSFPTPQGSKTPIHVASDILAHLKSQAEKKLGAPVGRAVITVPAYFDERARAATRLAARQVGLQVLRLINEPTAAALAYGLDQQQSGLFAFYDLGGGTFDVSLLRLSDGVFQVLATGGDTHLGGDDVDDGLTRLLWERCAIDPEDRVARDEIRRASTTIKEYLTAHPTWTGTFAHCTITVTRSDLAAVVAPLLDRTIGVFRSVLEDGGIEPVALDSIILVGGATRMPMVSDRLFSELGVRPTDTLNPDEIVCHGAAKSAHALSHGRMGDGALLLDVCALSLGIETLGGAAEKMILRNTPLPASIAQEFTTFHDDQQAITFHVVQGEEGDVRRCRSLGRFVLKDLPHGPAGSLRIRVTFNLDADGLLTVTAEEKNSGILSVLEIADVTDVDLALAQDLVTGSYQGGA